jgi:hypothetical protein
MSFQIGQSIGEYEFIVAYRVRNTLAQRFELLRVLRQMQADRPIRRSKIGSCARLKCWLESSIRTSSVSITQRNWPGN